MIAKNEEPSRNEPCSCGSGKKYKKCCMPEEENVPEFGPKQMSILLQILLITVKGITIPQKTFDEWPENGDIKMTYDEITESWKFWVKPPKKGVLRPGKRLILPKE